MLNLWTNKPRYKIREYLLEKFNTSYKKKIKYFFSLLNNIKIFQQKLLPTKIKHRNFLTSKRIVFHIDFMTFIIKNKVYSIFKKIFKLNNLMTIYVKKKYNQTKNSENFRKQKKYFLPTFYPKKAEEEANKISKKISNLDVKQRTDFRKTLTLTIDPQSAKDFDDALSIRKISDKLYEIGVHISDVTHYIKPGSSIDKEALKRGTSIYLTDKVIPMLPEKICNEICSLLPNEDKLCFSVIFHMDYQANVLKKQILKTIIRSNKRFSYDEVQSIINNKQNIHEQDNNLNKTIFIFHHLAKILRKTRFENGAIDFDRKEVHFNMDKTGFPLSISFIKNIEAHQLIEEFMLLANKTIAESIGGIYDNQKNGKPRSSIKTFIYRIHDVPNKEKIEDLFRVIKKLNIQLKPEIQKSNNIKNIHKLLNQVQGTKEQNLIQTLILQAMEKAIYTTKNIGHYGLAFDYYTHFTSPIRRYSDIIVHRLLKTYMNGPLSVSKRQLEQYCKHCSEREIFAIQAERASIKTKQIEFMSQKIGYCFKGTISGIAKWGIYVELIDNGCEGLIPIRYLIDDFYKIDKLSYQIIGKKNKKVYRLGDSLFVQVIRVNKEKNQLDFIPKVY